MRHLIIIFSLFISAYSCLAEEHLNRSGEIEAAFKENCPFPELIDSGNIFFGVTVGFKIKPYYHVTLYGVKDEDKINKIAERIKEIAKNKNIKRKIALRYYLGDKKAFEEEKKSSEKEDNDLFKIKIIQGNS